MRRLGAKAQATRAKILHAANDLFYMNGFNATGIDRIIAEAGVTKGNLFYHFKNKEELACAVLDWHRDLAIEEVNLKRILSEASPSKALSDLITAMTSRMISDNDARRVRGCFFGNFALELSIASEAVRTKIQEIFTDLRGVIRQLLEKAQTAGEIRSDLDPDKTAGLILGLLEGAVLLDKTSQSADETENAIHFIHAYLNG